MKKITFKTSLLVFAGILSLAANAQQKPAGVKKFGPPSQTVPCASVEYESLLKKRNPERLSTQGFEQWLAPKVAAAKKARIQKSGNTIVTIPVVFHIIHNAENPVGVAENISDERVITQIDVLNEDFRKLEGSNGYNLNPVGGDMEINFCLAKQDPDGFLSTGIVRYATGNGMGFTMNEVETIKTQTQWDPEKYLNIWVVEAISGAAGYAQFPADSGLEGLYNEGAVIPANTDGVALAYLYVGSQEKSQDGEYSEERNLGRTASHEVGHYFGLRHIWGDGEDCSATDFCDDTPPMLGPVYGCTPGLDTCPDDDTPDMIENYMSYSDDICVNIFTLNQKDRMQAVLENSPRRHSLITSPGCTPGAAVESDGSLQIFNLNAQCGSNSIEPQLLLTNSGTTTLTSAVISYTIDALDTVTYNWSGSLLQGGFTTIQLPQMDLATGEHIMNAGIVSINNAADPAPHNSNRSLTFDVLGIHVTNSIKVTIQTDNNGEDTLWGIAKAEDPANLIGGNINLNYIESSDFYESNQLYETIVPIEENDCYLFFIYDLSNNGMCCANGNGYYKVETADGVLITEGGNFNDAEEKLFAATDILGNHEVVNQNLITLYPNPANNIINITAQTGNLPESYTIYNSLGQLMDSGKLTDKIQPVDIERYAAGVYFIRLANGSSSAVMQFIKY